VLLIHKGRPKGLKKIEIHIFYVVCFIRHNTYYVITTQFGKSSVVSEKSPTYFNTAQIAAQNQKYIQNLKSSYF